MSDYDSASLPNLPKLNSLNKKPKITGPSTAKPSQNDFSISDDSPTDIGASDDILAAMGGIDGWDSIPEDSLSLAQPTDGLIGDTSDLFDSDESVDETTVIQSPFMNADGTPKDPASIPGANLSTSNDLPSIKGGIGMPVPKSPVSSAQPSITPASKIPSINDLPSLKSRSSIPAPAAPAPVAPIAAAPVAPAPAEPAPAAPVAPAVPDAPAVSTIESMDGEIDFSAAPAAPAPAPVPSAPVAPAAPAAPVAPAAPARIPAAPAPAPAAPAPTPVNEGREMTDEEQLEAILASMTPEERAEYEAHELDQQRLETERRRQKQRELMEMYAPSQQKSSAPVGLIIAIIIVIGVFGGGIYWLLNSSSSEEEAKKEAAPAPVEENIKYDRADPLTTYNVSINTNGASLIYINGVEVSPSGPFEFAVGHRNNVIAFADGMAPVFHQFEASKRVDETIDLKFEPASLYSKGTIRFRASIELNEGAGLKVTFDGRSLGTLDSVSDVVLGRPHVLIVEKPGFAKHLHLIWPDAQETKIDIPSLKPEKAALAGTECSIKLPPASGKPIGFKMITSTQEYNSEVVPTILPGSMIEFHLTREQRKPLQIAVIPDGFGTLAVHTTMLRDSIGSSVISFNRPANTTLRACLRRSGEVICPNMDEAATVPSGPDWEFFGAEGSDSTIRPLRGVIIQELQKSRKYVFDITLDTNGVFKMKQTGYEKIKE